MKSFLTHLITICSLLSAFGQSITTYNINGFPLDSIQTEYITAETCQVALSNRVFLEVDYGQESKIFFNKYDRVADINGNYVEFKSNMDALNYLIKIGYELIDTEYLCMKNDDIGAKYVLRNKVN